MANERAEYRHDNHWFVLISRGCIEVERTKSKGDGARERESESFGYAHTCTRDACSMCSGMYICARVFVCTFDSEAE